MPSGSSVQERLAKRIAALSDEQRAALLDLLDSVLPASPLGPRIAILRGGRPTIRNSFGKLAEGGFLADEEGCDECRFAVETADDAEQKSGYQEAYFPTFEQAEKVALALAGHLDGEPKYTPRPRYVWLCELGQRITTEQTEDGEEESWIWIWKAERSEEDRSPRPIVRAGFVEKRKSPVAYRRTTVGAPTGAPKLGADGNVEGTAG
ncbi:hypothetical protein [Falsiroseomonas sp.]|uniref:hypothetical protein n=1 Tax=Falsiroseomonas sp. TaxID=2870721 RepID=UPI003561F1FF